LIKKAKGVVLKPFVIGIRADKNNMEKYDRMLSDKAKEIVSQRILDSIWYPFDIYRELFRAVAKVVAKDNEGIVKKMGYEWSKKISGQLYKGLMKKREISNAINIYDSLFRLWFNFGKQHGKIISDNELHVILEDYDPDFKFFYILAAGWMENFFEIYLDTKVKSEILEKSWEGAERTIIKISWSV